jgi:enoyl-CoA hydratase
MWAASFASGAVIAMGAAKRAIDSSFDKRLHDGLDLETEAFAEVFASEDAATGVRSFLQHGPGKANFAGR